MLRSVVQSLAPGGRVVFVEYKAEDPAVQIKQLHKMTERQRIGAFWTHQSHDVQARHSAHR
jgi:hypothetical protein